MTPTLQLLQKSELPAGQWFVLNPPADWRSSALLSEVSFYSEEWAVARQFDSCEFGVEPNVPAGTEHVLLFLPKAKPRLQQLLHSIVPQLNSANLWVVGENTGGIKAAPKQLADYFAVIEKCGNAKRCGLLRCSEPKQALPDVEALSPTVFDQWQLSAKPGLFNKGQVDKGTELLLQHLPKLHGRVLDMGCGGGVISLAAIAKGAESVLAADSSAVALAAAQESLALNNTESVEVVASDVYSDIPRDIGGSFDWVLSNPPFHSGIATDYQPARRLIQDSKRYVRSGGRLMIVANRHLPYEQWLEATFSRWEVLVQESGFKVLVAYQ
ncbi:MAG: class I SAM-dependent methyltransferase [Gammaproteobacteria bacterium]|nr:class I SAM-dependent methyltransferase [Gammaproteobacteria bacterium]